MPELYKDYLQSDHWRTLRREAKIRWGDRCVVCDIPSVQIHHLNYRGRQWRCCTVDDVMPLCKHHHKTVHFNAELEALILARKTIEEKRATIAAYLKLSDEKKRVAYTNRQTIDASKIVFSNKSRGYTQVKWVKYENKNEQTYLQDRLSPISLPIPKPKQEVQDSFKF